MQVLIALQSPTRQEELARCRVHDTECGERRDLSYSNDEGKRSDCGTMPYSELTRLKLKCSKFRTVMMSPLQAQVGLLTLLYSNIRPCLVEGLGKEVVRTPEERFALKTFLFLQPGELKKCNKGFGAINFNEHIKDWFSKLKLEAGELLADKYSHPFNCSTYRHFQEVILRACNDEMTKGIIKGLHDNVVKMLDEKLMGHSANMGDYYSVLAEDGESILSDIMMNINPSDANEVLKMFWGLITPWGNRTKGGPKSPVAMTAVFDSAGEAVGLTPEMSRDSCMTATKVYLTEKRKDLLRMLLPSCDDPKFRPEQLTSAADLIVSEYLKCNELKAYDNSLADGAAKLPCPSHSNQFMFTKLADGKTLAFFIKALLEKFFVKPSFRKTILFVVPGTRLLSQFVSKCASLGLSVCDGNHLTEAFELSRTSGPPAFIASCPDSVFKGERTAALHGMISNRFLFTVVLDECHESYRSFRSTFSQGFMELANDDYRSLNFVFVSATCTRTVLKEIAAQFNISDAELGAATVIVSEEKRQEFVNYFMTKKLSSEAAEAEVIPLIKKIVNKGEQVLIAVLTNEAAANLKKKLITDGFPEKTIVVNGTGEVKRIGKKMVDKMVTAFCENAKGFLIMISTQPLPGLDPKSVRFCFIFASFNSVTALQVSGRVCRKTSREKPSFVSFYQFPTRTLSAEAAADNLEYCFTLKSYDELFNDDECVRCKLMLTSFATDERGRVPADYHSCINLNVLPCSSCCVNRSAEGVITAMLQDGGTAGGVNVGEKRRRSMSTDQDGRDGGGPRVPITPLVGTGPSALKTMALTRYEAMSSHLSLNKNSLCVFCFTNHPLKETCPFVKCIAHERCLRCFGAHHSSSDCGVNVSNVCTKICTRCFLTSCESFKAKGLRWENAVDNNFASRQLSHQCPGAQVGQEAEEFSWGRISGPLGVLFGIVSLKEWREAFKEFLSTFTSVTIPHEINWTWLFDAQDTYTFNCGIFNYNLVFLFWSSYGKDRIRIYTEDGQHNWRCPCKTSNSNKDDRICTNCGVRKPIYKWGTGDGQVWKDTSWICLCNAWNYSRNNKCFRCNMEKVRDWSLISGYNKYSEDVDARTGGGEYHRLVSLG